MSASNCVEREVLGIVGESGSGKSVSTMALLGLLPKTARITGSARFRGHEMIGMRDKEARTFRGKRIAMIFQDPMTSMNPVYTVGYQLAEAVRSHHEVSMKDAKRRAVEMLDLVGIPQAERRVDSYPHEFSGGMRQRAMIAMSIINDPELIIADEPTTALDVTVQAQVLETLQKVAEEFRTAIILITHDLGVIAGMADRVMVMYAGRLVERGMVDDVYEQPRMPYTVGLLGSVPTIDHVGELTPIKGAPPSLIHLPPGCPFSPRCPLAQEDCQHTEPPLAVTDRPDHLAGVPALGSAGVRRRSQRALRRESRRAMTTDTASVVEPVPATADSDAAPLLEVTDLYKHFPIRGGGLIRRVVGEVHAVSGVSFTIGAGETLGLVGESGSGKTTTGRTVLQLHIPTSGSVRFDGRELTGLDAKAMRAVRREMQIVFQDPYASLNPKLPVNDIIAEPLRVHGRWDRSGPARVAALLDEVGLRPEHGNRYPHEFSGGQRQRVRHRPGPRPRASVHRARRTGLGPRRQRPGGRREPVDAAAGPARVGVPVRCP